MNIPILRETITFANLPATFRDFQCFLHLLVRPKDRPMRDCCDSSLHSRLMNRRIHQFFRRDKYRTTRTTAFSRRQRSRALAKRLQNRLLIGFPLVARHQSRRLIFQDFRRFSHQQFRVLFGAFAIHDHQHKFVLGIERNVIPVIAVANFNHMVCVCVAMLFLFEHEVPLLVERDFFGLRGKKPRVLRGVVPHVRQRVSYND